MLGEGRKRLVDHGLLNVPLVQANAEQLPFEEGSFDCITIGFGLRNVTDKDAALRSMTRCLKPGGRLQVMEFSKPLNPLLGTAYDQYSFKLLPSMGSVVASRSEERRVG